MEYETLAYEQDEHVVTITHDRPDQHNALNREMTRALHQRGGASVTTTPRSYS